MGRVTEVTFPLLYVISKIHIHAAIYFTKNTWRITKNTHVAYTTKFNEAC